MANYNISVDLEIRGIKAKNEQEARDIFYEYNLNKAELMTIDIRETSGRRIVRKPVKRCKK